eukprot:6987549-Pyramimonas_sp.AAC.1
MHQTKNDIPPPYILFDRSGQEYVQNRYDVISGSAVLQPVCVESEKAVAGEHVSHSCAECVQGTLHAHAQYTRYHGRRNIRRHMFKDVLSHGGRPV